MTGTSSQIMFKTNKSFANHSLLFFPKQIHKVTVGFEPCIKYKGFGT